MLPLFGPLRFNPVPNMWKADSTRRLQEEPHTHLFRIRRPDRKDHTWPSGSLRRPPQTAGVETKRRTMQTPEGTHCSPHYDDRPNLRYRPALRQPRHPHASLWTPIPAADWDCACCNVRGQAQLALHRPPRPADHYSRSVRLRLRGRTLLAQTPYHRSPAAGVPDMVNREIYRRPTWLGRKGAAPQPETPSSRS